MNQSEYLKIINLAKTAIKEYENWDESEIGACKENIKMSGQKTYGINQQSKQSKNAAELLEDLKKKVCGCQKCALGKTRLNAVIGVGDAYADIMFVGEGPGFQEDHYGEPFIGKAGKLLDKIIEAMGYTRQSVYIANIVKCHPMKDPTNPELRSNDRAPTEEEMNVCKPYLNKQIEIIGPKVIITLGASSTRGLLSTDEVISSIRGKFQEYMGIKVMPTFHPAALLRNPNLKKDVWQDMKKVLSFLKKG